MRTEATEATRRQVTSGPQTLATPADAEQLLTEVLFSETVSGDRHLSPP